MTDEQITEPLTHKRRTVAVLVGAAGAFLFLQVLPSDGRYLVGAIGVAGICYCVYIATVVRVWNAHYRLQRNLEKELWIASSDT
jgi:hypothetical protein